MAHSHGTTEGTSPSPFHPERPQHEATSRPANAPLKEGEASGKVLFLDAFSGAAGDMIVGALLDLGVPMHVVENAIATLPLSGFHLHRSEAQHSGIVATKFDVRLTAEQPFRGYSDVDRILSASQLEASVKSLARKTFRNLAEAEAMVHRISIDDVHFHEVGAVDAIVDIVGACAAFRYLGATVITSPLPMSHGFVKAAHGMLPLPAPATVLCLRGCPTYGVDLPFELVTPTGAAILKTVSGQFSRWPELQPERTGYGAGSRELPDRPNLLRAVLGSAGHRPSNDYVIIEANVDDLTGEIAGHAIAQLGALGALDAWATPITMKKGRPGLTLSALVRASALDDATAVMLKETSTIGVRSYSVERVERPRRNVTVETAFGAIVCKVSEGPYGPPQAKPEFEECARAAAAHQVPVREVIAAATLALAREKP